MTPSTPPLPQTPGAPAPPPMFGETGRQPAQKPKKKSMQPSFLGTEATPTAPNLGTATLLGG